MSSGTAGVSRAWPPKEVQENFFSLFALAAVHTYHLWGYLNWLNLV